MVISPIMRYILEKEEGGYPSPTEREKLNKAIARYRNIIQNVPSGPLIGEIKFGLADLLVGRDESGDYREALGLYEDIMRSAPKGYLWAKSVVGHSEILIRLGKNDAAEKAVKEVAEARETLQKFVGPRDFFTIKSWAVEAELFTKLSLEKNHEEIIRINEKIIKYAGDHPYFKARAEVGRAEAILYFKPRQMLEAIRMCQDALKTLKDRPQDYFAVKSRVILAELLVRRGKDGDFEKAEKNCKEVIEIRDAEKDLKARAMLTLAQISSHPKAQKLSSEVLQMEGLDPYVIEKARQIEGNLKTRRPVRSRR